MAESLTIRNLTLGEGAPATIVSVMDAEVDALVASAERAVAAGADVIEWRADFSADLQNAKRMAEAAVRLRDALPKTPLLFTFRSVGQGGAAELPVREYLALCQNVVETDALDLIDIELGIGDSAVLLLGALAREHGVHTVISHHDFSGTPETDELVSILVHEADLGASIPKLAVMANSAEDAACLLAVTARARELTGKPLITMAMGEAGAITRLVGEQFGSAATFCAVGQASAPGQIELKAAKRLLAALHEALG